MVLTPRSRSRLPEMLRKGKEKATAKDAIWSDLSSQSPPLQFQSIPSWLTRQPSLTTSSHRHDLQLVLGILAGRVSSVLSQLPI